VSWLTQWSQEEELFADYTGKMQAPWERLLFGLFIIVAAIVMVAMEVVRWCD